MTNLGLVFVISNFLEAVHVQLTKEGIKITMFENCRQDFLTQCLLILHNEKCSGVIEGNDVLIVWVLK